jgi:cysteine synthase
MSAWMPSPASARSVFYGIIIGFTLSYTATSLVQTYQRRRRELGNESDQASLRPIVLRSDEVLDGVTGLIGM